LQRAIDELDQLRLGEDAGEPAQQVAQRFAQAMYVARVAQPIEDNGARSQPGQARADDTG
jgi:hypothetical protein